MHDHEFTDKDRKQKAKSKKYADNHSLAIPSNIQEGDKVLMVQDKADKLTTAFIPAPITPAGKTGSRVVENEEGTQYCRNTSDVKKIINRDNQPNETLPEEPQSVSDSVHSRNLQRNLQLP